MLFLRNAHELLGNEKAYFGIGLNTVQSYSSVHFSVEALPWKVITFIWEGKNFMKCFWRETHMCYSEMRSGYSGYLTLLLVVITVFIFFVEDLHWKISTFFWKDKIFMKCFCETQKCFCVTQKREALVWNM